MMRTHVMTAPGLAMLLGLVVSMFWAENLTAGGQSAQPARQTIDVSTLGPQVGEQVPDFSLTDQTGRTRDLQSIMSPRGAMVVFLRSADW